MDFKLESVKLLICPTCKEEKPSVLFYMENGRSPRCKECLSKYSKKRNKIYKVKYSSEYIKISRKISSKKHKQKYPEKRKAVRLVEAAVRSGKMLKSPCKLCDNPNTEAHHKDYSKPFEVVWLCKRCHENTHHKNSTL